ncbi:MAG: hypothetical protein ACM3SO_07870 [Betaproteobacteria bacterium]
MKLVVSLIAILFAGSVLLVNAMADTASDARPKADCATAHHDRPAHC